MVEHYSTAVFSVHVKGRCPKGRVVGPVSNGLAWVYVCTRYGRVYFLRGRTDPDKVPGLWSLILLGLCA